jgi:hypothetical protein
MYELTFSSLSEFGCNKPAPRSFGEVSGLFSDKMTSVYSGGLAYEYTMEENNYGIVSVKGDVVQELPDFQVLKNAFQKNPMPSGDGGYKKSLPASTCPTESANWRVKDNSLPLIPEKANAFFKNGAGSGPGIKSDVGSQNTGTPSPGWTDGSGEGPKIAANPSSSASGTSTASKVLVVSTNTPIPVPTSTLLTADAAGSKTTGEAKKNEASEKTMPFLLGAVSALVMFASC